MILLLCLSIFSLTANLKGQEIAFPKYRLGITPTSFANWHPAMQLSFDRGFKEKYNFALEGGYVFTSVFNGKGYRLRPGIEMMIARGRYIGLSGGFHINYRHSWEYNINRTRATNGEFLFINYDDNVQRILIGANLSENLVIKLSKRIFLELGSGFGVGSYFVRRSTPFLPERDFNEFNNFGIQESMSEFPIFYIHFNFSYAISL